MKTKLLSEMYGLLLLFAVLAACGKDDPAPEVPPSFAVTPENISAPAVGGSYPVAVVSHKPWSVAVDAAATWCSVSPLVGAGNGSISVTVAAQPVSAARSATITLTAGALKQTVTVAQSAPDPVLSTDNDGVAAAAAAGTYAILVTSNTAWTAAVEAGATWCSVSPATATAAASLSLSVAANPVVAPRTAAVTLAAGTLSQTVTVTQAGVAPVLSTDYTTVAALFAAGTYAVFVTSNTAWTATVEAAATWCGLSPAAATGTGSLNISVSENAATATRTAIITLAAGTAQATVKVEQAPLPPPFAASTLTWALREQTWSDAIRLPECNKDDFDGGAGDAPRADCRSYTHGGKTFYYYSSPYVIAQAGRLCPAPWRVPTKEDFQQLQYGGFTASNLVDLWGYGGRAENSGIEAVDMQGMYYSADGTVLTFNSGAALNIYEVSWASYGAQVRCLR
jgi:predicted small lipoprotein YifL